MSSHHVQRIIDSFFSSTSSALGSSNAPSSVESADKSWSSPVESGDDSESEPVTKKVRRSKVKHRVGGFNPAWKKDFTWLESVKVDGITGMRCKLCANHRKWPQNWKGSWIINRCFSLRRDKVIKAESSAIHRGCCSGSRSILWWHPS